MNHYLSLVSILLITLMSACDLGEGPGPVETDPDTPSVNTLSPTNITETGFQLNWSISSPTGFQSIAIELAEDKELSRIIKYEEIADITSENYLIDGLKGARAYYYRLVLLDNGTRIAESEIKETETTYRMDNIDLVTEDAYTLSGKLAYLESLSGSRPGIIMMHEFGVWVNPWTGSTLMKQLVAEGYVCLTFFFRGHGTSDPVDDLMDLVNNKGLLINDLQAAITFMSTDELVRPGELGLLGGSMGAIMALAGNGYDEVLTSVALSPTTDGVFLLFPNITLNSVYYLVGEQDIHEEIQGGDFPAETQTLYELTEEPKKLDIIEGTSDHGSNLLSRDSLNTSITDWILERVPV